MLVGETFDIGPEFAVSDFKYKSHTEILGRNGERGKTLTEARDGSFFPYGSTGVFAFGDGRFYFSHNTSNADEHSFASYVHLYRMKNGEFELM